MRTSIRAFLAAGICAALQGLIGCGSIFDTVHMCAGCTVPTFLVATGLNTIASYKLSASGVPTQVGSQSGPNSSEGIVVDRSGAFVYVSDFQNGSVDAFAINPTSGVLSPITGSPFAAGPAPGAGGIAVDPGTRF